MLVDLLVHETSRVEASQWRWVVRGGDMPFQRTRDLMALFSHPKGLALVLDDYHLIDCGLIGRWALDEG